MKQSVFLVIAILKISSEFEVRCPVSSEWNFRAAPLICGNTTEYVCLYDDFNMLYSESCDGIYEVRAGRKNVRSPGMNNVNCLLPRYQPFTFTTNGNSDCVYGKSLCSEEGQVVASNGTTTEDVGCRCDYTKGYTYTSTPENKCSCVPSKEDCSCYIKPCPHDEKLNADYICVEKSHQSQSTSCLLIWTSPSNGTGKTTLSAELFTNNISETRTSAQDAVVGIIVIVLIYVVLLLVLFVQVEPYLIRTDVQYREDLIVDKCDESLKCTLIPGDNLIIEWEVKSWFPVKSIIAQKDGKSIIVQKDGKQIDNIYIASESDNAESNVVQEDRENIELTKYTENPSKDIRRVSLKIESDDAETCKDTKVVQKDGENTQLKKNKYSLKSIGERKLSLTINKLESDDAGTYTCIATNVFGLSNNFVDRCINWLLNMETGLDLRKCLMNFPICRLAVINPFQANVINLKTTQIVDIVLNTGENVMLEINCNQNITFINWFKCDSNNITAIPLNDRYSGGTTTDPSLQINSAKLEDAGEYMCVVKCSDNDIVTSTFKLKVILQEDIYKEIICHRKDQLYVKTSTVDKAYQCLSTHGMVVLSGRKGTGKSKMCLELASLCEKDDFQPFRIQLAELDMDNLHNGRILYIIDNVIFKAHDLDILKKILTLLSCPKHQWIVITCASTKVAHLKDVLKDSAMFQEECILNLNNSCTDKEKTQILETYFTVNNISRTSLQESNYRNKDILSGNIPVKVDRETTEKIIKSNPYYGFPLTVVQFCGDRKRLHLGERYFTLPPKALLETVEKMYHQGKNGNVDKIHQYCILVYIAFQGHLDVDNFDVNIYKKMSTELFDMELGTDIITDIQKTANNICGVFIEYKERKYELIHSCMVKVLFMSSHYCAENYLIGSGSFQDIKDCVRSYQHKPAENESVYKLTCDHQSMYRALFHRLIFELRENIDLSKEIYIYMYTEFIQLRDTTFLKVLIEKLDMVDKLNLERELSVWQIIAMLDGMTNFGTDPWIYSYTDSNETLQKYPYVQCALIAACRSEYLNRAEKNVFMSLISIFEKCLKRQTFVESLGKSLDINGNTFYHYLTLHGEEESCYILGIEGCLSEEKRDVFGKANKLGVRPIEMAAFMGKFNVLKLFYVKTSKKQLGLAKSKQVLGDKDSKNKIKKKWLNKIVNNGMNHYFGSGKSSVELDITVNFESDVLASLNCGKKENYLAMIKFFQMSKGDIEQFVKDQRKATKKTRTE